MFFGKKGDEEMSVAKTASMKQESTFFGGGSVGSEQPKFMTTTMKEKTAERNGARRIIFGVKPKKSTDEFGAKTSAFPFETGGSYVGNWVGDKKEGFGTQTWTTGDKYEGEWRDGRQNGKGSLWKVEGGRLRKRYAGDWADGKRTGLGVFIFKNGDKYEGEWVENRRQGNGAMTYADGTFYEGGWVDNQRCGLGVLRLPNGDRYEGHWLGDAKEGPGRFYYVATGQVYEGEWVDGAPKCGTFRAATLEEQTASGRQATAQFALPQLALTQPEMVLSKRVAEIRQKRAAEAPFDPKAGFKIRSFGQADLDLLHAAFASLDKQQTGLVAATSVGYMLERCRMPVDDVAVERLLLELEADDDTRITFAEFCDIAALLTSA